MSPFEALLWVLAAAVALIVTAIAVAVVMMLIRAAVLTPLGKQKDAS